ACPDARPEGLGRAYKDGLRVSDVMLSTLLAAGICWPALELRGAAVVGLGLVVALTGGWWLTRCLGGLTGDCYGALNEVAEVVGLLLLVAMVAQ
ncbi:MAG TPA: adenosylcobinamide-GDP ribazoletransferase, partial [Chloroflexota bacterium]|nr:adenosylcobinamide-GDP ribazoletransferase [Chloroflexota bacterium]